MLQMRWHLLTITVAAKKTTLRQNSQILLCGMNLHCFLQCFSVCLSFILILAGFHPLELDNLHWGRVQHLGPSCKDQNGMFSEFKENMGAI